MTLKKQEEQVEPTYYIPELNEFRFGFEYDYREKKFWVKQKCNWDDHYPIVEWIKPAIRGKKEYRLYRADHKYRVKCLDSKDWNELGWEEIQEGEYYKGDFYAKHDEENLQVVLLDEISGEQYYKGTIRNKSELERILELIGIE
jgi:hypothetical protein